MKFETKAIWVGQEADPATGATIVPIYQTSTFTQEEVNKHKGYEYSRVGNPTRSALDKCLASLEEGRYGLTFSSGLAAEHAIFSLLKPGDHVIVPEDMYGGTFRLIKEMLEPVNIKFTFTDFTDPDDAASSNNVWISYIDRLCDADSEAFTAIYSGTPRNLYVRVRDGGGTPIKTYESAASLSAAGGGAVASRIVDV